MKEKRRLNPLWWWSAAIEDNKNCVGFEVLAKLTRNYFSRVIASTFSETMFTSAELNTAGRRSYDYSSGSTSKNLLTEASDILKEEFKVKTTREVTKFVGLEVTFEKERKFIHQKEMLADLLEDCC